MAIVRPMKRVGSDLRAMTSAEVTQIIDECIRLYGNNPGISLTVTAGSAVGAYEAKLGAIADRRLPAGVANISASPNPSPGAPPAFVEVNYVNTLQRYEYGSTDFPYKKRSTSSYQNYSYPLFYFDTPPYNGTNPPFTPYLRAMSWVDMYDTFIKQALIRLATGTTTPAENAGTYFASTATSETDATLVSSTPIAKDTISDVSEFVTGDLPEVEDQPDAAETSWYLHRVDAPAEGPVPLPITIFGGNDDFKTLDKPKFRDMLLDLMQYWAYDPANSTNTSIRYQYGTSAFLTGQGMNQRGSGITDTYTTTYYERTGQNVPDPNATEYYSQQVPGGTATVQSTNYLGIGLF